MTGRARSFRVGGAVPGVALRLGVVALVWAGVVMLNPFPLWQGVAVIAALVAVVFPRSLAAWAGIACLPFGVILTEPSPVRTAIAVLLVHAIHVLASFALVVPAYSRFALGVLVPSAGRFVVVQMLAQPVVLGVWLLMPERPEHGVAWLAPVAAVVLLLGVLLAVRAARREDTGAQGNVVDEAAAVNRGANVRGPS
jgi:hypothetical protein